MRKNKRFARLLIAAILIGMMASIAPSGQVFAAGTTLSVSPVTSTVNIGSQITITINIADVTALYGYDVQFSFDPAVIQIVSVTNGTFLSTGTQFGPIINNTLGTVWYANAQLNPAEAQSGSGTLVSIVLKGKAAGQTALHFTSTMLSDRSGFEIPVSASYDGTINVYDPTSVNLSSFTATGATKSIILNWETTNEADNLGFNLYRANSENGKKIKLNNALIPTNVPPGSPFGAIYSYTDMNLKNNKTYYYWLESVDISGHTHLYGPVMAKPTSGKKK